MLGKQKYVHHSCYDLNLVLEGKIALAKLKKYKSQGSNQNLAELIQAGGETLQSEGG
jgi:hypothetical protein